MHGGIEMKKIICALLGCFLSISVFAVQIDFTGGESTSRWYVSYETLRNVIYDENLSKISEEQAKRMLEKYWEIRSASKDDKITSNDLGKICQAGGVGAVNKACFERIVIPLSNKMKQILQVNACADDRIPKDRAHCIGDVFTTVYNTYSSVHTPYKKNDNDVLTSTGDAWQAMYPHFTHGLYAQDVVVDEWTAYGFAIEYIKKHAGDVDYIFCNPEHGNQMISCVTGKNKNINDGFWTIAFRYIGTDGDAEENKIKAICALNEADFVENSCNPMPHVRINPWDCRAGCDMECEYYNHRDLYQQIARMGLNSYGSSILTPTCRMWQDTSSASGVREYPGFEHISHVFENIQAVLNKKTVDRIKTYIFAQNIPGIGFDDIDCNWGAGGVRDGLISKVSGALLGTDPNDHKLTCLIGDKTVDIVFDDLYETNRHKLKLGSDGYKCLMVHRKTGYTQFNGEECIGVTKEQCIGSIPGKCGGLCAQVPGGTTWDDGVCILNDANLTKENMELILKTSGEVALLFTGYGEVILAYVAGTELFDVARKALEDEKSHRAHNHVDDFINDANKCNNKFCAKQIVTKYMHSIMQYSNDFNDDEIDNVGVAILKLRAYLTPEEFEEVANASTKMESDKFYDIASIGVFIGDLFFNPNKLGKIGKVERVLSQAGIKSVERYGETLGNAKYFRVYVDGFTDAQKNNMIAIIQKKGLFVGANKTKDGRAFLGYSDKNIFGPWSNDAGNWLKNSTNVLNVGDILVRNLENAGIHPHVISKGFFQVNYRTGRQCQTGLKFHVSVNIEDLQEASFIVDDLVRKSNVADVWKVETNGMGGSQLGKDFTIYVSQDGYDINKIQGFLNELESRLKSKNIRPNGYGSHVRTGDKPVVGSDYINYRYDRTNASGVPDGVYNGSYVFVAPKAEYGGDIMTGVRDISGSGGGTVHIPDGTGAGDIGTAGTGKSKMGRVIPVGTAAAGVYIASKIIGGGKDDDVTTDPNTDVGTPSDVVDFNESDVSPDGKINIRTDDNSTSSWSGTDDNSTSSGSGTDDGTIIGGNTDVDNNSGHSVQDSLDVMMNILGGN